MVVLAGFDLLALAFGAFDAASEVWMSSTISRGSVEGRLPAAMRWVQRLMARLCAWDCQSMPPRYMLQPAACSFALRAPLILTFESRCTLAMTSCLSTRSGQTTHIWGYSVVRGEKSGDSSTCSMVSVKAGLSAMLQDSLSSYPHPSPGWI